MTTDKLEIAQELLDAALSVVSVIRVSAFTGRVLVGFDMAQGEFSLW